MIQRTIPIVAIIALLFALQAPTNAALPPTDVYLLIGQSNMVGIVVGKINLPQHQDLLTNPQITVLGYSTTGKQVYNTWSLAQPPLHAGAEEAGVGIGDNFAKEMLKAEPTHDIALVPCGINGAGIDLFEKGVHTGDRKRFFIPPDDHWYGAYPWILQRAKLAMKIGHIRGILFHQGETDYGSPIWPAKVARLIQNLRSDLGIGADVPVLIGDLGTFFDDQKQVQKPLIRIACQQIPNAHEISSDGLVTGGDNVHFNIFAYREFGRRYAAEMIEISKHHMHLTITSPMPNQKVKAGKPLVLRADANATTVISKVGFYENGALIDYALHTPYEVKVSPTIGKHTYEAVAFDPANVATSKSVTIVAK